MPIYRSFFNSDLSLFVPEKNVANNYTIKVYGLYPDDLVFFIMCEIRKCVKTRLVALACGCGRQFFMAISPTRL